MGFDLESIIERCFAGTLLKASEVKDLCAMAESIMMEEENVVQVQGPVTVVGDLHGQFYDLLELFRVAGGCPDVSFVFLGDYVDRGLHSVETICLLLALKCRWPSRITLLRGNHETRQITKVYGFFREVSTKFDSQTLFEKVMRVFDALPLVAVVDNAVMCVHGGLSPYLQKLDQLWAIDRFHEPPADGIISDLMWSDPDSKLDGFRVSNRGAGFVFGASIVRKFLHRNSLRHILRAHQLCMSGYQVLFDNMLSTVWSAPNYCYRCGNKASVLRIDEHLDMSFTVFESSTDQKAQDPVARPFPEYFL